MFSISLKDIGRHTPVVNHGPVLHKTTHPFGQSTTVASLAAEEVRRELADATPLASGPLEETLSLWATFCDDVADRLNDDEPLAEALDDTWVLGDGHDVDLDDEPVPPASTGGDRRSGPRRRGVAAPHDTGANRPRPRKLVPPEVACAGSGRSSSGRSSGGPNVPARSHQNLKFEHVESSNEEGPRAKPP